MFFSTLAGTEKNHIKDFFFKERGFVKSVNTGKVAQMSPIKTAQNNERDRHW